MSLDLSNVRRVVTGLTEDGRSTTIIDGPSPHVRVLPDFPTFRFTDLWVAKQAPADNSGNADNADGPVVHTPPPGGNVLRMCAIDPSEVPMHITPTLDYAYIISGELTCVLEDGEINLKPGDVLIQRGTIHAWSNTGDVPCVMLGVLIDAEPQ